MKQLHFVDYKELAKNIVDTFSSVNSEEYEVSVIAKYSDAKEIFKELIALGNDIASVELHDEGYEGYYNEYILVLNSLGLWSQKFKIASGYLTDYSDVTYIMDNCSCKVIPHCEGETVYEVAVGEDDEFDLKNDMNEDIHGFTLSSGDDRGYHSISYYTTNPLSEEDIRNVVDNFGFTID